MVEGSGDSEPHPPSPGESRGEARSGALTKARPETSSGDTWLHSGQKLAASQVRSLAYFFYVSLFREPCHEAVYKAERIHFRRVKDPSMPLPARIYTEVVTRRFRFSSRVARDWVQGASSELAAKHLKPFMEERQAKKWDPARAMGWDAVIEATKRVIQEGELASVEDHRLLAENAVAMRVDPILTGLPWGVRFGDYERLADLF